MRDPSHVSPSVWNKPRLTECAESITSRNGIRRSTATCDSLCANFRSFRDFGRSDMRNVLATLIAVLALLMGPAVGPAAAQNAKALLQAADNAVGASKVNSI